VTKVITVPQGEVEFKADHPLTLQTTSHKLDFKKFALTCVRKYDFFGKGYDNIVLGKEIKDAINACDGTLELGHINYTAFHKAVEARQWNQEAAEACLPFIDAVRDAKEKKDD
jgi:hypothetical protein